MKTLYRDVDKRGANDGEEPPESRVGDEAADEGHHGGDPVPVVDVPGRRLQILMQHLREIHYEVGGQPEVTQPFTELDCCMHACMHNHNRIQNK